MHRNIYYKQLCKYCGYRVGFDTLCKYEDINCTRCNNSDINGICYCCKDKSEEETTCPYFRYLAR